MPPPSKEFSDIRYVQGSALTGVRYISGPGENVGADAVPAARGRGAPAAAPAAAPATIQSTSTGDLGNLNPSGLPLLKPPYGRITAINLDRGEFVWQVAHGDTPDGVRNNPALKGLTIPRTGQAGAVGALVTKTLLIIGEPSITASAGHPRGALLRAYDKATGKDVGGFLLPAPQSGTPMTYLHNGKQHIVLAVSGGTYSGEYLALRLP
jgi:quinoprotein glucose dehydrogenase